MSIDPLPRDLAHRPEIGLKPPAKRRIVHRRTYRDVPLDTVRAARDLLDIDAEFLLFVHTWTNEDVVAYDHRFLSFTDSADERGRVIYLRHDGDYRPVEPP